MNVWPGMSAFFLVFSFLLVVCWLLGLDSFFFFLSAAVIHLSLAGGDTYILEGDKWKPSLSLKIAANVQT